MTDDINAADDVTPRTIIHDATLSVYEPAPYLPDFDVFAEVVDASADTIEAVAADEVDA